jgi:integrase
MPQIDAKFISKVPRPPAGRKIHWDDRLKGFGLMVMASGHTSFVFQYRAAGKLRRMTLEATSADTARTQVEVLKGKIATGRLLNQPADPLADRRRQDAVRAGKGTFGMIAETWHNHEVRDTRSGTKRFRQIERLVFPAIGNHQIHDIRRGELIRMLDTIKANQGAPTARACLGIMNAIFSWYEGRDEDFRSPTHRSLRKVVGQPNKRQRTLNDKELRAVWYAALANRGPYGALVRFLLLTATRREEAAQMRWGELTGGNWTIPASRYKTKIDHVVPLSAAARKIIDDLPKIGDFVFAVSSDAPIRGMSDRKGHLDTAMLDIMREDDPLAGPLPNWTIHDLRRTARTLMGRARVPTDIAERCLGHVKDGERGTYDCWGYLEEKREAFEALATIVNKIVY